MDEGLPVDLAGTGNPVEALVLVGGTSNNRHARELNLAFRVTGDTLEDAGAGVDSPVLLGARPC
jgi:hypothetical protein